MLLAALSLKSGAFCLLSIASSVEGAFVIVPGLDRSTFQGNAFRGFFFRQATAIFSVRVTQDRPTGELPR
jgi:hypothetical protein